MNDISDLYQVAGLCDVYVEKVADDPIKASALLPENLTKFKAIIENNLQETPASTSFFPSVDSKLLASPFTNGSSLAHDDHIGCFTLSRDADKSEIFNPLAQFSSDGQECKPLSNFVQDWIEQNHDKNSILSIKLGRAVFFDNNTMSSYSHAFNLNLPNNHEDNTVKALSKNLSEGITKAYFRHSLIDLPVIHGDDFAFQGQLDSSLFSRPTNQPKKPITIIGFTRYAMFSIVCGIV